MADNGVGIARGRLEHLFDGTLHPEEGREDARRDMGIGLSVCRTVVTAHGGTITAETKSRAERCFASLCP